MPVNYKFIGIRIRELRTHNNLTQAELAELIDMSVTYISHIERANKHASLETLSRISNVLYTTVDRLLNGNQFHDPEEYLPELVELMADCDSFEKKIIFDVALAAKKSLRDNKGIR